MAGSRLGLGGWGLHTTASDATKMGIVTTEHLWHPTEAVQQIIEDYWPGDKRVAAASDGRRILKDCRMMQIALIEAHYWEMDEMTQQRARETTDRLAVAINSNAEFV